jgi:DNA-binding NarL/FixJ family response regulator
MTPIRVLLVDDHPIVLDGLRALVSGAPDMEVVAAESRPEDTLTRVDEHSPDLVLLDIQLGSGDGIELCRLLKTRPAPPAVVLLSAFWNTALVRRALDAGTDGYLLKDADVDHLLQSLRDATAGIHAYDPAVAAEIVRQARGVSDVTRFSERDRELLVLVSQGLANKQIAARLELSPHTVRDRLSDIMLRLGAKNRAESVHLAQQRGLI